ncbi:bacillithiol system redox-active protein YtxJ [Lutibacter citreus]|uniref:bacillithiol system redox-active protein YtxJ n=1 Tax=Lutibacter citreus TaxID=2138210 RepID=UPI000DBE016A|nr:bacillithiol system redox-active protein YtxJ [Lutibacter citreus]
MNWSEITEIKQLEEIINSSKEKPVLIFKHSTRCGISRFALKSFERSYDIDENSLDLYFLDLISYRQISSAIAEKLGVYHESPQVIVILKGTVIYSASHGDILVEDIKKAIG